MGIIFGILRAPREQVKEAEMVLLASPTLRYAPDGTFVLVKGNVGMGFQPYYTHERSRLESRPASDSHGNLLVFDGRLDNHGELSTELGSGSRDVADSLLILAAFERWGEQCFSRLIGDWALALWSACDQVTYLARDHAGTRTLYFAETDGTLRWSTYLETFFAEGERYALDEQYAAHFLCGQPIGDLTPYAGIRAVPPAHYLAIKNGAVTTTAHWSWIAKEQIRYKSDLEYQEHLFSLLAQSVQRRTTPGAPILAELSGGMDSTAIVCLSDHIRKSQGAGAKDLLDTISYYNRAEPNWNEEPYFSVTETRRGKKGIHIDTSAAMPSFDMEQGLPRDLGATMWPGTDRGTLENEQALELVIGDRGYRTILSGIGGDEVLGGVPNPLPELADLLVSGNIVALLKQGTAWCLSTRTPLLHMLYAALRFTAGLYGSPSAGSSTMPPWVSPHLSHRSLTDAKETRHRHPRHARPSALCNGQAWWSILETQPHRYPQCLTRREYRYPFLDRDLVDYLFRIPRAQLVRPGNRRSLMKRTLADLIPAEVLNRRRKAYLAHWPVVTLRSAQDQIERLLSDPVAAEYGFIDRTVLLREYHAVLNGQKTEQATSLIRTAFFEMWLRASQSRYSSAATPISLSEFLRADYEIQAPLQAI